jgi:hypothetical protein
MINILQKVIEFLKRKPFRKLGLTQEEKDQQKAKLDAYYNTPVKNMVMMHCLQEDLLENLDTLEEYPASKKKVLATLESWKSIDYDSNIVEYERIFLAINVAISDFLKSSRSNMEPSRSREILSLDLARINRRIENVKKETV